MKRASFYGPPVPRHRASPKPAIERLGNYVIPELER